MLLVFLFLCLSRLRLAPQTLLREPPASMFNKDGSGAVAVLSASALLSNPAHSVSDRMSTSTSASHRQRRRAKQQQKDAIRRRERQWNRNFGTLHICHCPPSQRCKWWMWWRGFGGWWLVGCGRSLVVFCYPGMGASDVRLCNDFVMCVGGLWVVGCGLWVVLVYRCRRAGTRGHAVLKPTVARTIVKFDQSKTAGRRGKGAAKRKGPLTVDHGPVVSHLQALVGNTKAVVSTTPEAALTALVVAREQVRVGGCLGYMHACGGGGGWGRVGWMDCWSGGSCCGAEA